MEKKKKLPNQTQPIKKGLNPRGQKDLCDMIPK
jgi:hypothetical protein